tara:strand:+ start:246 stop:953 length:708 start_codon:yes stop_codon:yes gene_type:complete
MIIVNGDSFVQEAHLDLEQKWSTRIKADSNLALGAGSNDRIFYTTIDSLTEETCDVLIIGWTSWVRTFLSKSDGSRYRICVGQAADERPNKTGGFDEDKTIADMYYKKIFNEFTQLKNTLMYMLHLQQYCELKKIKLINFATVFKKNDLREDELQKIAKTANMSRETKEIENAGIQYNKNILKKYISKLDPDTWINKTIFSSMSEILDDFPKTDICHIGAEGSKHWADIIKRHLD